MACFAGAACGFVLFAVTFLQISDGKSSDPKGSATVGLLVPHHSFLLRRYISAFLRSIAQNKRTLQSLSEKFELSGHIKRIDDHINVSKDFCGLLGQHRISTVIILFPSTTSSHKKDALKKAAEQQLPVIIWDKTGTTSRTWKGSSGLVLNLTPTVEQNAIAVGDLTDEAAKRGWQNIGVICDDTSGAGEFITQLKIKKNGKRRLMHYTYEPNNKANLTRALFGMKVARRKVMVLYTSESTAIAVLKEAARMRMTGKSYFWILSNAGLSDNRFSTPPPEFPVSLIGFKLDRSKDEDVMKAIGTAVTIWARGLDSYVSSKPNVPKDVFVSKGNCTTPIPFKTGAGLYSAMLNSGSGNSQDPIFSERGTSVTAKLQAYHINNRREWEKVGVWTERGGLKLINLKINWPPPVVKNSGERTPKVWNIQLITFMSALVACQFATL